MGDIGVGALLAFIGLSVGVLGGGLAVVLSPNIFHAAVGMALAFLAVAGIYFSLQADFLAVIQILIYVGAIAVMIAFAVMLTRRGDMRETNLFNGRYVIPGLIAAGGFALIALYAAAGLFPEAPVAPISGDITMELGKMLLTQYALPFEVAAVLLLVALIGAIIVARAEVKKSS